ncbi:uncharacterized protein YabE (DUF348 family) [Actinoalloteichus hoggarensis]|uniref:Resuscitation-promoting factor Rpf2 n=1 Tax=Actinoalloteichus hoggarensis TaxID=1470176 RepID=A0A221VXU5_9PSEU|nr:resuscitation-promoting factor [Actinoalloteichus hoggarensis]ASO18318.1 Resuscitation-promoting factor Rpf2 precursor [Actinoalloteichus hoggarensis]MBB5921680.1 uncharacterized protein YabE (DUF348 family) [Actinoalloteichus hoggarensis]
MKRRTLLRAMVIAVLAILISGSGTAIAMDKAVAITVDGERQSIRTFATTVAGALASAGFEAGAHDAVAPSVDTAVADGSSIVLKRGRLLTLQINRETEEAWTQALTLGEALEELGMRVDDDEMSLPRDTPIPLEGLSVELDISKLVQIVDGGGEMMQLATNEHTVGDLLAAEGLALEDEDSVTPSLDTELENGLLIEITRTRTEEETEEREIPFEIQEEDDPELPVGETEIDEEGVPGIELVTYRVVTVNGEQTERTEISAETITEPEPRKVRNGTKEPEVPDVGDTEVWERLAQCESTGNWQIVSANGLYYGGLQFSLPTWNAYGGGEYATYPNEASKEQQIAVAIKLRDANGGRYNSWPHCASQLGLPR